MQNKKKPYSNYFTFIIAIAGVVTVIIGWFYANFDAFEPPTQAERTSGYAVAIAGVIILLVAVFRFGRNLKNRNRN